MRILGKAMAREPQDRYSNAREMAVDLEKFIQGRKLALGGGRGAFHSGAGSLSDAATRLLLGAGLVVVVVVALIGTSARATVSSETTSNSTRSSMRSRKAAEAPLSRTPAR